MKNPSDISNKIYNNYKRYIPQGTDENLVNLMDPLMRSLIYAMSVSIHEEINQALKEERLEQSKKRVKREEREKKDES